MLATPTTKDFTNIMTFLLRQIDPHLLKGLGKLEEEVPALYKRLRYPFQARACLRVRACVWCARLPPTLSPTPSPTHPLTHLLQISKSNLTAVGSPHTWPSMLAALTWLVELLCYQQRAEAARADVGGERARAEADFFQYVATSYRHFMAGALGGGGVQGRGAAGGGRGGAPISQRVVSQRPRAAHGGTPHPSIHPRWFIIHPPPLLRVQARTSCATRWTQQRPKNSRSGRRQPRRTPSGWRRCVRVGVRARACGGARGHGGARRSAGGGGPCDHISVWPHRCPRVWQTHPLGTHAHLFPRPPDPPPALASPMRLFAPRLSACAPSPRRWRPRGGGWRRLPPTATSLCSCWRTCRQVVVCVRCMCAPLPSLQTVWPPRLPSTHPHTHLHPPTRAHEQAHKASLTRKLAERQADVAAQQQQLAAAEAEAEGLRARIAAQTVHPRDVLRMNQER